MKNQTLNLLCTDLSNEGYGVCRHNDLVIFVKDMLVDEEAVVKIIALKKKYAYGIIEKIIKPSKDRIIPDCIVNSKCGGCNFRYLDYQKELAFKQKTLDNTFNRINNLNVKVEPVVSCNKIAYRNKAQLPIIDGKLGFYRVHSHDVVDFDYCYVQSDLVNEIIAYFKEIIESNKNSKIFRHLFIRHFESNNEVMLGFIVKEDKRDYLVNIADKLGNKFNEIKSIILNVNKRKDNVIINYDYQDVTLYGRDYIIDKVNDLSFMVTFKSFYQVNHETMLNIYDEVLNYIKKLNKPKVLDLYSGLGTIGLYVAKNASNVLGIEIINDAVKMANSNAKLNNINNAIFLNMDAKDTKADYLNDIDVVIVDPPRKGLGDELKGTLVSKNVNNIIYVSCNPLTLAKDLKFFKENGYDIDSIKPFDMFPRTVHVECIALIQRVK